ncbi:MAG: hydroxyacylglutathione hydrolase [Kangiellaceae bacterium]|nr:hydroxyacylglutathione hydrolase [Kangiellaceae bacterium]
MLTRPQQLGKPVRIIPIKAFTDNYIWTLFSEQETHFSVVDPGDAQAVIAFMEAHELTLDAIFITHHHHDHTGGVQELQQRYGCYVYAPEQGRYPYADVSLKEGDCVSLWDSFYQFEVLEVPGHTMDHIAYYDKANGLLFCGDTLFKAGCGRMFEGTPEQFYHSLEKLKKLPAQTQVYCTHEYTLANLAFAQYIEPDNENIKQLIQKCQKLRQENKITLPSTIECELLTNPFLRCETSNLQNKAAQVLGKINPTPIETFATIRQLKDNF